MISGVETADGQVFAWRIPVWVRFFAQIAAWVWRWNGDRVGQRPLLGRLAAHTAVVLILLCFMLLGSLQLETITAASEAADAALLGNINASSITDEITGVTARSYYRQLNQSRIVREAQSFTAIPERPRLEILMYTVQVGDTAESIANQFGLQPTTLMWSNPEMEKAPDLLRVGQVLTILPMDGAYYTVEENDTLEAIAEKYKVEVSAIRDCTFNTLLQDEESLLVGLRLVIPGGSKPYETRQVTAYGGPVPTQVSGQGRFFWPAAGVITQGYWYGHRAIDIGATQGAAILAADSGYISFAGWTDIGYGYLLVVNHRNGFETYYAHLSNFFVTEGQVVSAGQVIGAMGNTGNSTGPHLHFEIRYNGYPTNPWIYLP